MEKKDTVNYTNILNKIFISLIIIILFLFIITVGIFTKGSTNTSTTTDNTEDTTETEYDVSDMNQMTTTEALASINSSDMQVIYIGRSTCTYCVKFLPILKEAQTNFGYTTTYIDITEMTTEDQTNLSALDSYISENFGSTPMIILAKDGKYVNGTVGYSDYETFAAFLTANGLTAK